MAVSLTNEQVDRLHELADENFEYAVSVGTDRAAAEGAVKTLMASFMTSYQTHWVPNPEQGDRLYDELAAAIVAPLYQGIGETWLRKLRDTLWCDLIDRLRDTVMQPPIMADTPNVRGVTRELSNLISNTLPAPFARYPVHAEYQRFLNETHFNSLAWSHAFYVFCGELHGLAYRDDLARRLDAMIALSKSAFALWVLPGHAILCMKPVGVRVENCKAVGMTFADELVPELLLVSEEPEVSRLDRILLDP